MRKMFFFVLAAAAMLLMVPTQNAQAQSRSETPKVEVGAQYTLLRFRDFSITDSGVGGRVTFNLSDNIGIEGELNVFPQRRSNNLTIFPIFIDSTRTQGLFGVKTGLRSEKLGIFGKLRPGFVRFGDSGVVPGQGFTQFALDFGGVFELYPSRSVALRFDLGDTVIRFSNPNLVSSTFNSNNLQISTGVSFRF